MKHRHTIYRLVLCSAPLLLAIACSDPATPNSAESATTATNPATSDEKPSDSTATAPVKSASASGFGSYIGDNICDILPVSVLQQEFAAPADLTGKPFNSRRQSSCSFSWPRPDAEERKQAMMKQMMQNMQKKQGEQPKLDIRSLSPDYTVSISLMETKATAATFVPVKLDEAELQKRIDQATDAANKRLTDAQKKAVGKDGVGNMAASMIRKTNERVVIDGVGDAAYWLPIMGGSLSVLAGGYQITVTPNLADDDQENIEAARKVAAAVLR